MKKIVLLLCLTLGVLPFAHAQTTSADFSAGSVIIGPDTRTCVSGLAGALRYNGTSNKIEYCNGTAWTELGS